MDQNEQQIIDGLFDKLRQVEAKAGPRDDAAERRIGQHLRDLPAAPYYMAQAIVVQEQALESAQARIQQLEQELQQRPAGGFLGGLFGGGGGQGQVPARSMASPHAQRLAGYHGRGGGGFMAGAMQTALGVAGGVIVGNMLMDAFSADPAAAAEAPLAEPGAEAEADPGADAGDFGGDFGMDEF